MILNIVCIKPLGQINIIFFLKFSFTIAMKVVTHNMRVCEYHELRS